MIAKRQENSFNYLRKDVVKVLKPPDRMILAGGLKMLGVFCVRKL